jgi:sulfite exporter TauE/SafE
MSIGIEIIGPAFIMGFAGSLHCIGMCGPLALSLPVSHSNDLSRIIGSLIYNSGRIFSYTALGLIFGSVGNIIIATRWQSSLSLALGIIILLYLIVPKKYFHLSAANKLNTPFHLLRYQLGKLFKSDKRSSLFAIGILNGFLPCGLIYLALSSAIITANSINGGMFMLFFGLGTFPAMFATVVMGNYLNQNLRLKIRKVVQIMLFFMAVLLILRGMELGIPFVSPAYASENTAAASCH